jgi:hypothetical protein
MNARKNVWQHSQNNSSCCSPTATGTLNRLITMRLRLADSVVRGESGCRTEALSEAPVFRHELSNRLAVPVPFVEEDRERLRHSGLLRHSALRCEHFYVRSGRRKTVDVENAVSQLVNSRSHHLQRRSRLWPWTPALLSVLECLPMFCVPYNPLRLPTEKGTGSAVTRSTTAPEKGCRANRLRSAQMLRRLGNGNVPEFKVLSAGRLWATKLCGSITKALRL